jgi:hypothetical protein
MDTADIRRRFIAHFEAAGHTAVPSASLLLDDPNLLFVNAGMVQFVPYFLGQRTPPWPRATPGPNCLRPPAIDAVGKGYRLGAPTALKGVPVLPGPVVLVPEQDYIFPTPATLEHDLARGGYRALRHLHPLLRGVFRNA